jgi:MFS family permease
MPRWGVHVDVLKLGLVSLLTDLSSEMIFAIFALFFTVIAGGSVALLGVIEGLADFASCSLDYIAGWSADRSGRRKPLTALGYGFSTAAKVLPLIASTVAGLGAFRVIERLGKSLRGPPRDAWLAAIAHRDVRGYSFGVHKALDKSGAILGPLCVYGLLTCLGDGAATYRVILWAALLPAVLAVILLLRVRDAPALERRTESLRQCWRALSGNFRRFLAAAGIFSLAYFSFGFLLVRAHDIGFSVKDSVLLYALINLSCVVCAPAVGRIGDRIGRRRIILSGYLLYSLLCVGFAMATRQWQLVLLFIVYGLFYAIDEAQTKAFIADIEPDRRASAIGVYNFVMGLIYVPASLGAGALWLLGPASVFLAAAALALLAAAALLWLHPVPQPDRGRRH